MTSVAEARAAMLEAVARLAAEIAPLTAARGRTLAAPLIARRAQPPFAASAMDGYALRCTDTPGRLRIVGESAAGHAFTEALRAGEAVRISTGAPVPDGADAVLIQEEALLEGDMLVAASVAAGQHVRDAGIDFCPGAIVLPSGRRLSPPDLGLAAAAGAAEVAVIKRPRVAVLCAGDELVAPGAAPRADQIFDSCSFAVAAFAEHWGAEAIRHALLRDDEQAIRTAAERAAKNSDLVVFVGAASVGPHDHARAAFERLGARFLVHKVNMRPGKPTWFATTPFGPVLGLPGNPASALVAAELFLRSLIAAFLGCPTQPRVFTARSAAPLPANGSRETYVRARVENNARGEAVISALTAQDSSLLSVFAEANALLVRPANAPALEVGACVAYLPLGTL